MNRATPQTGWARNPDGTLGYTLSPISGCLNGCSYCYARQISNGRVKPLYLDNKEIAPLPDVICKVSGLDGGFNDVRKYDPFWPRFWPGRLDEIRKRMMNGKKDRIGVFLCDMGELFGPWLPRPWTSAVLDAAGNDKRDIFYVLTKQGQELKKWSFPDNVRVGVSAWDTASLISALHTLAPIHAKVKFISLEPILDWTMTASSIDLYQEMALSIDWLIIGAQTKPQKLPKLEWLVEIVEAADEAEVPVFLKENLRDLFTCGQLGYDIDRFWQIDKEDARKRDLRHEMPRANNG